jgi:hypothetical protein
VQKRGDKVPSHESGGIGAMPPKPAATGQFAIRATPGSGIPRYSNNFLAKGIGASYLTRMDICETVDATHS